MEQFAELYDQLTAYESSPDPLHYTTRFIDGLKPGVRMAIAMQKPRDLDTAYELALLHEELGEMQYTSTTKRSTNPSGTYPYKAKTMEDKKPTEGHRSLPVEDKWTSLRNFRRAKGLCFICGEKWSKDHQCKSTVQLHVVQELIDQLQSSTHS